MNEERRIERLRLLYRLLLTGGKIISIRTKCNEYEVLVEGPDPKQQNWVPHIIYLTPKDKY